MSPLKTEAETTPNRQCRDACTGPHRWFDTGDGVGGLKYWCKGPLNPKPALAADFVDRMLTDIRTKVVDNRFEDDALSPDLLAKVLNELRAASQTTSEVGLWAGNLLQALWHRAESGVPFNEPVEPAWSLDPELRVPKRGE